MFLDPEKMDALKEVVNIGIGNSAGPLSELTDSHIQLSVPDIKLFDSSEFRACHDEVFTENTSAVEMRFDGFSSGVGLLAFPSESSLKLVEVLAGEELGTPDMDSVKAGILTEFGNIILGHLFGAIGNCLEAPFNLKLPEYYEGSIKSLILAQQSSSDLVILIIRAEFIIRDLKVNGRLLVCFSLESFPRLISAIEKI